MERIDYTDINLQLFNVIIKYQATLDLQINAMEKLLVQVTSNAELYDRSVRRIELLRMSKKHSMFFCNNLPSFVNLNILPPDKDFTL